MIFSLMGMAMRGIMSMRIIVAARGPLSLGTMRMIMSMTHCPTVSIGPPLGGEGRDRFAQARAKPGEHVCQNMITFD